ncbi:MAG: hypothetical protein KME59_25420 [Trichormus sp. ATA11-4-KO1]|jgi:hypothetical protein|nr:hypothetical protein [Trichormus sp. ATA11-4-KO1]
MGDETLGAFFREADAIAQRIREWNEYRLEQEIAAKKRTLDIEVEKTSDAKAVKLAYQKLETLQAWNEAQSERKKLREQRSEQFKSNVFWFGSWIGSGKSGIFFFICAILIFAVLGLMGGLNWPTTIACKTDSGGCYLLRWNKSTVVLPHQVEQVLKEYERSKNRKRQ